MRIVSRVGGVTIAVLGCVCWLSLLVLTGFNGITVACGLLAILTIAGRRSTSSI